MCLICYNLQYADEAQQAFLADKYPTLYNTLPTIKKMYCSWEKASKKWKYDAFAPALEEGMSKLNTYYKKTVVSDSHIMVMCMCIHALIYLLMFSNLQFFILHGNWLISTRTGMPTSLKR